MIVGCKHSIDGQQVPCPPMCPVQQWPRSMFRLTLFRGRWVLRRRFREGAEFGSSKPSTSLQA